MDKYTQEFFDKVKDIQEKYATSWAVVIHSNCFEEFKEKIWVNSVTSEINKEGAYKWKTTLLWMPVFMTDDINKTVLPLLFNFDLSFKKPGNSKIFSNWKYDYVQIISRNDKWDIWLNTYRREDFNINNI